jgi:prepilin-type processing-associated H-X9-DG protein
MWTESIKHFAEQGNGNVIFLDGSVDGMQKTLQQLMATNKLNIKD